MKCLSFYHPLFPRRPTPKRQWWVPVSTAERGDWCLPCFSVSEKRKSEKPEPQTCRFGLLPLIMLWVSLGRGTTGQREVSDQYFGGQVARPAAATWWEEHLGFLSMPWWRSHDGTAERCGYSSSQGPDTCGVNKGLKQTLPPGSGMGVQSWGDQSRELFVINKKGDTARHQVSACYFSTSFLLSPSMPPLTQVQFISVQLLSHVSLRPPWTATHQASLSITNSQSLLKFMFIESVMPSNHLILYSPLLLPPSVFLSIRVFSNESALCIRWLKYWSFSLSLRFSFQWFPLGWTGWISLQSKGFSRVFSNTTVPKHQTFSAQLSL